MREAVEPSNGCPNHPPLPNLSSFNGVILPFSVLLVSIYRVCFFDLIRLIFWVLMVRFEVLGDSRLGKFS